jgi:hypothetical protein
MHEDRIDTHIARADTNDPLRVVTYCGLIGYRVSIVSPDRATCVQCCVEEVVQAPVSSPA